MAVITVSKSVESRGNNHMIDITADVARAVESADVDSGIATIFVTGSTGGVTAIEFEPGLVHDLDAAFERLFPRDLVYRHHHLSFWQYEKYLDLLVGSLYQQPHPFLQ